MARILEPHKINGTTKYYFGVKLDFPNIFRLLEEFETDDSELHINEELSFIKIINNQGSTAIEINNYFISFYPVLDDISAEKIRSRIYKLVAKKSEVYLRTSKNNIELAVISLLKNDLRGTASLLYYSLHKSINGLMYHYFNDELKLDDYVIDIEEVAHFTSALYYTTSLQTNFSLDDVLTSENYLELLCNKRSRSVNPFLSLIHILNKEFESIHVDLVKYVEFLVHNLFEYDSDPASIIPKLIEFKESFLKAHSEEKTSQEYEVKAAIADCIIRYYESELKSSNFLLYIFAIRLYWLRQTADYDFDFEVKTSIREVGLLTNIVKNFVEIGYSDIVKQNNNESNITTASNDYDMKEDNLEKDNHYYHADLQFDSEIVFENDITHFMSAMHLDFLFNHDKIIDTLNLIGNITNRGKYFIFESSSKAILHIYISEEGKWTFWFDKGSIKMLNGTDLRIATNEFFDTISKKFREIYDYSFDSFLIQSHPITISSENETLSTKAISQMNNAIKDRTNTFTLEITKLLASKFRMKLLNYSNLGLGNVRLTINLAIFKENLFDLVPLSKVFQIDNNNDYLLQVIIADNLNDLDEVTNLYNSILIELEESHNLGSFSKVSFLIVEPFELEAIIINAKNNISNKFWQKVIEIMNQIAYFNIIDNGLNYQLIFNILEKCLQIDSKHSRVNATLGLWHLRNPKGVITEGKKFYENAIELEEGIEDNNVVDFKQKFHYEYAKALIERLHNKEEGIEYLAKALEIGEKGNSYDEVKDLIEIHNIDMDYQPQNLDNIREEVASTLEENN